MSSDSRVGRVTPYVAPAGPDASSAANSQAPATAPASSAPAAVQDSFLLQQGSTSAGAAAPQGLAAGVRAPHGPQQVAAGLLARLGSNADPAQARLLTRLMRLEGNPEACRLLDVWCDDSMWNAPASDAQRTRLVERLLELEGNPDACRMLDVWCDDSVWSDPAAA